MDRVKKFDLKKGLCQLAVTFFVQTCLSSNKSQICTIWFFYRIFKKKTGFFTILFKNIDVFSVSGQFFGKTKSQKQGLVLSALIRCDWFA